MSLLIASHLLPTGIDEVSRDAATLVKTIFGAIKYIHDNSVVHRGAPFRPFMRVDTATVLKHLYSQTSSPTTSSSIPPPRTQSSK